MDANQHEDRRDGVALPTRPVPFAPNQESGSDVLGGASPLAMNVVVDAKGSIRRRPGVADLELADKTIGGLATDAKIVEMFCDNRGILYAVQEVTGFPTVRSLFRWDSSVDKDLYGVSFVNIGNRSLKATTRPVFAQTEAMLAIASGEIIQKVDITAATESVANLGGSPPKSSHVIANASRVISNDLDDKNRLRYSGTGAGASAIPSGHETWSATDIITAEARPDPVVAVHENTDEVFAFGQTNLQVFAPSAQTVYEPIQTREVGLLAAYSVIKIEQRFAWLDQRRRFVLSDGREFQFISEPIQQTLDDMSTVTDCFGYRVFMGPIDMLVWTFPTEKVTLCYQLGGGWSQWGSWDAASNNWGAFLGTSHAFNAVTNENYIGADNGVIGVMTFSSATDRASPDLDPATSTANSPTTIPAFVETGAVSRDTAARKWCKSLLLGLRRGDSVAGSTAPAGHIQYRDENGPWSDRIPFTMGATGDHHVVVPLRGLGTYRFRQWRLWFDGDEPFTLVKAEEDYEVLEV